jgi:histidine triad (HIT) family protein
VPRDHYETLGDLPAPLVGDFFADAQRLATAVEEAMEAEGTFVAMNNRVSQSVPHLHVHVVPRRRKDGLRGFFWPRQRYESEDEMVRTARGIRDAIRGVG